MQDWLLAKYKGDVSSAFAYLRPLQDSKYGRAMADSSIYVRGAKVEQTYIDSEEEAGS